MKRKNKIFSLMIIIIYAFLLLDIECLASDKKIHSYWELKFLNIDRQEAEFSCGVAVLATLFTYYFNIPVKEDEITEEFFKKMIEEKRGISFLDMKRFALSKGFDAYGYKMNIGGLIEMSNRLNLPIIVHMKSVIQGKEVLHFTLLTGITDDYLILNDTAFGHIIISIDDFLSKWSGYALIISPKEENSKEILERVTKTIKKEEEKTAKYVSKIYFYQNHPKRFDRFFTGF